MKSKKNLLVILKGLPWPMTAGGDQAMYNGIVAIKNDYNVSVVYMDYRIDSRKKQRLQMIKSLGNVQIDVFIYNNRKKTYDIFKAIVKKIARKLFFKNFEYKADVMMDDFLPSPPNYIDYINTIIKKRNIEIVQIEMIKNLSIVLSLPQTVKKVFVHHELRFVFNRLLLNNIGVTHYRKACQKEAEIMEIGLLNMYDAIITLSDTDSKKLKNIGVNVPIYSSKAVVNTSTEIKITSNKYNKLSFIGPERNGPNVIGLNWFLSNCWEQLLKVDPSYKLYIIGQWSDYAIDKVHSKYQNIIFLGYVEDLAKSVTDSILIVPITIGSGIRMKILEASSLGIPFVTTSIGVEGLPFKNLEDCFIADTPEDFIQAILTLRNKELRMKFIVNANKIVRENYSIEALRENRIILYESLFES